jgi:hypothetical protein
MFMPLHQNAGQNHDSNKPFEYIAVSKYLGTTVKIFSNKTHVYKKQRSGLNLGDDC